MTITVLPMDATAGAPAYTAKQARQAQAAVYGNPTARVFGTRSGWRVGTLPSIVSVTSTTWTLNPCACVIEPAASLYQGAYGWASDAVVTGPVTAADGTNPRIDILYIQVNDSSAGDGSGALSAPPAYLAGTAAATPAAPTLPPRSFLVATIAVPKSGAGSPTVTFNQTYFTAAGGVLPVMSQADLATLTPYPGMAISRIDLSGAPVVTWDGSKWNDGTPQALTLTPSLYTVPATFQGQAVNTPAAAKTGRRVDLTGVLSNSITITFNAATPYKIATLPAGLAPVKAEFFVVETAYTMCRLWVQTDGTIWIQYSNTLTNIAAGVLNWSLSGIGWNQ